MPKRRNTTADPLRLLDRSEVWGRLAEQSLLRYRAIEQEAGIKFYSECGFLSLIDDKVDNLVILHFQTFVASTKIRRSWTMPWISCRSQDTAARRWRPTG